MCLAQDDLPHSLAFQLLVYPATDFAYDTRSYEVNGQGMFLETASMRWFWDHYVDNTDLSGYNIFVSPMRARLSGDLPPALVITAEFDPLRDEGEAYAAALDDAGVATTLIRYDGVIHGLLRNAPRHRQGPPGPGRFLRQPANGLRRGAVSTGTGGRRRQLTI